MTTEKEKVAESDIEDSRVTVEKSEGAKSLTEKSQVLNTKCEKTKSKTEVIKVKQKVRTTISPGIIKIKNVFEKDENDQSRVEKVTGPSRVKSAVNSFEILMQSGKASLKTKESDSGSKRKRQVEKVEKVRKKSKVQSNTLLNWSREQRRK